MSQASLILDQVTSPFLHALQHDGRLLQVAARKLFYYLALIQLTLSCLWMSLMGVSLQTMLVRLVQMSLAFGVFYACIESGSQWVPQLINGFVEIGQQGGIYSLSPSAIIEQGMSIASSILNAFFGWGVVKHPFVAMIGSINCIAILILYALLAAELAIVLVKSYVLVAFSSFFFALGANQATRPMTVNYIKTIIGIGLKLMTLYFLLGVGQQIGSHWTHITQQAANSHELTPMLAILAAVIVYYMIIKNVPPFIAGLSGVGGFHNVGDNAVATAIGVGMQGRRVLTNAKNLSAQTLHIGFRTGQAVSQAVQLGKQSRGNIAGVTKVATGALAKAAIDSGKVQMSGRSSKSFGQRVNKILANRLKGEEE